VECGARRELAGGGCGGGPPPSLFTPHSLPRATASRACRARGRAHSLPRFESSATDFKFQSEEKEKRQHGLQVGMDCFFLFSLGFSGAPTQPHPRAPVAFSFLSRQRAPRGRHGPGAHPEAGKFHTHARQTGQNTHTMLSLSLRTPPHLDVRSGLERHAASNFSSFSTFTHPTRGIAHDARARVAQPLFRSLVHRSEVERVVGGRGRQLGDGIPPTRHPSIPSPPPSIPSPPRRPPSSAALVLQPIT
jgi:hypothetical protein